MSETTHWLVTLQTYSCLQIYKFTQFPFHLLIMSNILLLCWHTVPLICRLPQECLTPNTTNIVISSYRSPSHTAGKISQMWRDYMYNAIGNSCVLGREIETVSARTPSHSAGNFCKKFPQEIPAKKGQELQEHCQHLLVSQSVNSSGLK